MGDVAELHVDLSGPADGPVLVMGGSLGTTLAMWDRQVDVLARSCRVVRFDHRGHGRSPAPAGPYSIADLGRDVLAALDRLGLKRVSYCGLSIGGMVGMWLAANAPERIEKLVLVCTSAHLPPADAWLERAETVRRARSLEPIADVVVRRWLTPDFARAHPELGSRLRAMLLSSDPEGYAACCEAIAGMDLRDDLATIRAETLVITAADDLAVPAAHSQLIAARVPGARLMIVAPGAHIPSLERPDQVSRLVAAHLGQEPDERSTA